jgi:PAS domain S-box-containing protein
MQSGEGEAVSDLQEYFSKETSVRKTRPTPATANRLLDHHPEPILEISPQGITYANTAAQSLFPYLLKSGSGWQEAIHEAFTNRRPIQREIPCRKKVFRFHFGFSEKTDTLEVFGKELTELKTLEECFKVCQEEDSLLFDSVPALIWIKDDRNRILRANRLAAETLGLPAISIEGHLTEELYPDEATQYLADDLDVIRSGMAKRNIIEPIRFADGSKRWVRTDKIPCRVSQGTGNGVLVFSIDITELKLTAEALRQSTERFEAVGRACRDVLWDWDMLSDAGWWNENLETTFGYPIRQTDKLTPWWSERVHPQDHQRVLNHLDDILKDKSIFSAEYRFRHADGHYADIIDRAIILRDHNQKPYRMIGTMMDITEVKKAERQLEAWAIELASSNADLQQFAYIASHDLKEPVRMVKSFAQLLKRRYYGKLDKDADDFIGFAVEGAERIEKLINDLLTYSRVGTTGKPLVPTNIDEVLAEVLENLRPALESVQASVQIVPLPILMADRFQLAQVFSNLIENAIKFRRAVPFILTLGCEETEREWVIEVTDNGIGIGSEDIERIFLIFQRLHSRDAYPGSGLGLAVTKKIMARHGGRIWASSKLGEGSTFHLILPKP